jgi:ABC-type antimicrobial peptide transport system permease subunit
MVVSVVLLIFAHKQFKEQGDGFMSYGQGVGIGFWIALISLIIGGLFTFIYVSFIEPTAMDAFYDTQRIGMEEKGMPDEQIDMAISWTKKLFWPIYIFFGLFFGVLVGVIVSIFTQKKNPQQSL